MVSLLPFLPIILMFFDENPIESLLLCFIFWGVYIALNIPQEDIENEEDDIPPPPPAIDNEETSDEGFSDDDDLDDDLEGMEVNEEFLDPGIRPLQIQVIERQGMEPMNNINFPILYLNKTERDELDRDLERRRKELRSMKTLRNPSPN
uniref:TIMELESS-interacting protein n=1 Tax=Caenorhabditis tropicalis TaxID=1561998 RepID=A0A1I7UYN6_9PELO